MIWYYYESDQITICIQSICWNDLNHWFQNYLQAEKIISNINIFYLGLFRSYLGIIHGCAVQLFQIFYELFLDIDGPRNIQHEISYVGAAVSVMIEFNPLSQQNVDKYHVKLSKDDGVCLKIVKETVALFPQVEFGTRYTPSIVAETIQGLKSIRSYGLSFWTSKLFQEG